MLFTSLITAMVFLIIFVVLKIAIPQNIFELSKGTKILIIGDSHVECAINDDLFENSINFAQSGDNYMYSFTKLKAFKENNPDLKQVILSYSYFNILEPQNNWYSDAKYIKFKGSKYFRLLEKEIGLLSEESARQIDDHNSEIDVQVKF